MIMITTQIKANGLRKQIDRSVRGPELLELFFPEILIKIVKQITQITFLYILYI